ncbi:MAG: D-alanyl-D-alanine carboxypeptidase/D-alanyl-D-alanine-endopeptidase [Nocardioides sp.]|uniref:D-alanyl-D-alanine carboxypeptidase/D-alanyl-D-alanine endopeptidase n=1 Tax=Nocardioides sp. TaxID=35761 RepID=UPI0039E5195C
MKWWSVVAAALLALALALVLTTSAQAPQPSETASPEPWDASVPTPAALTARTPAADPDEVAAVLRGRLSGSDLGSHVLAEVAGLTGDPLVSVGTGSATPASTAKLLTTAAALHVYGPEATFATRVLSPRSGVIVLVGGGDPLLATEPSKPTGKSQTPVADLTTLAATTATALKAAGVTVVRLAYDDSLFAGPATSPAWPSTYVPEDVVSPVSALRVDEGLLPGSEGGGRDLTPAVTAARRFAALLESDGITVGAKLRHGAGTGDEVARVESAPLRQIVEHTLQTSDNDAAETLAHLVGARAGDGSFSGGATATTAALTELGVPLDGVTLADGSGLSHDDALTPAALTSVLRLATTDPDLQVLSYGLPVAGFSGSLAARYTDDGSDGGLGVVRAKTGTLTGVSALAGFVTDADGTPLVYVVIADEVPVANTLKARQALDDAAAALATCHCSATASGDGTATAQPSATVAP